MSAEVTPFLEEEDDSAVILGFEEDQRVKLGKAPAWAHHMHNCLHETKREVQRQRHKASNREMAVDQKFADLNGKIDLVLARLGEESDDGDGGRGLIGKVNRNTKRIASLEGDRNKFWGALAALTAAGALLVAGFRAWIVGIAHGVAK